MRTPGRSSLTWRRAIATALLCAATPLAAQDTSVLRLPRLVGDGMVVQRRMPVPVWGWARAGDTVVVRFAGASTRAVAAPDGAWRVALPALDAGGPHEIVVASGERSITVRDVLVGDVWVASGQSNMEWPVARVADSANVIRAARDAGLRQFKVPTSWSWTLSEDVTGGAWMPADSAHVGGFSGVAYFFGRELRVTIGVPIGIINTAWGGSNIETWMSREALGLSDSAWAAVQGRDEAYRAALRDTLAARLGTIPTADSGLVAGRARWADPSLDDSGWLTMAAPGMWESQGYAGMDGVAWYRKTFTLSRAEAARGVRLGLGAIDDDDITWVNGVEVGRTADYATRRVYAVPATALHAGRNVVTIRVSDGGGGGGLTGPDSAMFVDAGDGRRPLSGAWKFRVGQVSFGDDGQRVNKLPAVLYNAMLHPLLPFPVKGVIWYQGESNANTNEQAIAYRERFATLIESWRAAWTPAGVEQPMPFLWAQLASYGRPDNSPPEHAAWAIVRDAQTATLALPATGQAVTIDIGNPSDIHPRNKQEAGRRLALQALRVAYGRELPASGPTYRAHTAAGGRIVIEFDNAGSGLRLSGEGASRVFAIAGKDGRFVWANARADGPRVVVWSDSVSEPMAVRYAWGNSPIEPSLYNAEGLPAVPFRTDAWLGTWMSAPQLTEPRNLPPAPGLAGNTLRQTIQATVGGERIRVRFSNEFGNAPLTIMRAHVALTAGGGAIDTTTDAAITFGGRDSLTIAPGQRAWSDALAFHVPARGRLAVTLAFGSVPGDVTGHPGSRTTSQLAAGEHVRDPVIAGAVPVEHWYVLTGVDVVARATSGAVVALGNSITDGRGSGTDRQNRWTDNLARRLLENAATADVSVLNAGIGGGCVARACLGPAALDRLDRDVFQQSGARWVIVLHGINDIGTSRGDSASRATVQRLIASYRRIIGRAHAAGLRVHGATLLPFGGSGYDTPEHEAARAAVNHWIRSSGAFDAVIDLEAALRDPAHPSRLLPEADTGDHLHPNERGYELIAAAIDLTLFRR